MKFLLFFLGLMQCFSAFAVTTGRWVNGGSTSSSASAAGITATISGYLGSSCLGQNARYSGGNLDARRPDWFSNPYGGPVHGQDALSVIVCFGNANGTAFETKTITVAFSRPVDNPVLHVDRLGGASTTSGNTAYTNSSYWQLASSAPGGVTLSRLSGNQPLYVAGNEFVRSVVYQNGNAIVDRTRTATCALNNIENGTACGSIQFRGTGITSLTFRVSGTAYGGNVTTNDGDLLVMSWSVQGATIALQKQTADGYGAFDFTNDNTTAADTGTSKQGASTRLATAANANPVASQRYQVGHHGDAINLTEAGGPGNFLLAGASCRYTNGQGSGTIDSTLSGRTLTIPANAYLPGDDITCSFFNQRVEVTANPDTDTTAHGQSVDINVGANDTVLGGTLDPYSIKPVDQPANGSAVCGISGDASGCRYIPNPGFSGTDRFTYEICDKTQPTPFCSEAEVTVVVGPNAVDDSASTPVNTAVGGNAAANDSMGPNSTFTRKSEPAHGTVILNPDGSYTYTPNQNFVGEDRFTYEVCLPPDPQPDPKLCDTATVAIKVDGGQIITRPDRASTPTDTPVAVNVAANDSSNGSPLDPNSIRLKGEPNFGTAVCDAWGCTYTPNGSFSGEDKFHYEICDSNQPTPSCKTEEVTVIVGPDAHDDRVSTPINTPVSGDAAANDHYGPGSAFKVEAGSSPADGSVTMNPDGTFTYTPRSYFTGEDRFTYQVCLPPEPQNDPNLCDTATVVITVNGEAVTTKPDEAGTAHGTPVLIDVAANDSGLGLNRASTERMSDPAHGTVTCNAEGCTYTPNADFSGTDEFTYKICNSNRPTPSCAIETVTVRVGPKAVDDEGKTKVNAPLNESVAPNDIYGQGSRFSKKSEPAKGTVTVSADGTYTYTPKENFVGEDSFTYEVCLPPDPQTDPKLCATAIVRITIVGGDVVAEPDMASTPHGTAVAVDVARNDSADGTTLNRSSTTVAGQPTNGAVTCDANGCTYTPNAGFSGEDKFTYRICDNSSTPNCDTAEVTVKVGPKAEDDSVRTPVNTPVSDGNVAANDAYGPGAIFKRKSGAANGWVTLNSDGTYTYEPNENFVGEDVVVYTVCLPPDPQPDSNLCSETTLRITVEGGEITTAPDNASTSHDQPVHIDVAGNDHSSGTEFDHGSLKPGTPPINGTVVCDADGCIYTPNPGFSGEDEFTYEICDSNIPTPTCSTNEVTVAVGPKAVDDSASTPANTPVSGSVAGNDVYGPGSVFKQKSDPANGSMKLNPDGSYTYTPRPDFVGNDSFTYEVCLPPDPQADPVLCSTATVLITVERVQGGAGIQAVPANGRWMLVFLSLLVASAAFVRCCRASRRE